MQRYAIIISAFLIALQVSAQGLIQKVNAIKLSDDYIYAQYADTIPDSAFVKGVGWLALTIDVKEGVKVSAQELIPYVKQIFLKGHTVTRAFVYMKKADIKGALETILKKREQCGDEAEEEDIAYRPDSLTLSIMAQRDIYAVRDYFESCLKNGDIIRYGSPKNAGSMDDKHLVLFNGEGLEPICVLSPVLEGGERHNLIDGSNDSLGNHHGCFAIWFTIKE